MVEEGWHYKILPAVLCIVVLVVEGAEAVGQLVGQGDDGVVEVPVHRVVQERDEAWVVAVSAGSPCKWFFLSSYLGISSYSG